MAVSRFVSGTLALVVSVAIAVSATTGCSSSSSAGSGAEDAGGSGTSSSGSASSSGSTASSGGASSSSSSSGGASSSSSGGAGGSSSSSSSGAGSSSGAAGQDSGVPVNDATLVLDVPAGFTGTTREIDVVVTPTVPIAGPPAGILYQVKNPVVTAGESLTLHGDTTGVDGTYYVVVVLYMQGGGQFSPTSGVDYETQSKTTFAFDGTSIDLGTMSLELAGTDAGP